MGPTRGLRVEAPARYTPTPQTPKLFKLPKLKTRHVCVGFFSAQDWIRTSTPRGAAT
jgi:hypothetical protein